MTVPPAQPPVVSPALTRKRKLALLGFGLFVFALLLAASELLLWLLGVGKLGTEDPFLGFESGVSLFRREQGPDGTDRYRTRPEKMAWFNEQDFMAVKPAGSRRIFTLGGSTTYGRPYDDNVSFSAWTRRLLQEMSPQSSFEVINAGGVSYASHRVVLLMRELVTYQPDLFVVYTGHNEFLEERTYAALKQEPALQRTLRRNLNRLRTYRGLRSLVAPEKPAATPAGEVTTRLDVWAGLDAYRRDEVLKDRVLTDFAGNLQTMVDIARGAGAKIVFINPADNNKDFSPFKSQHSDGLDAASRNRFLALLAKARGLQREQKHEQALLVFNQAARIDPEYAEVHFRQARSLLALSKPDQARARFNLARELDVCPLRCLEQGNLAVAEICARENIPMIDLPGILEADSRARFGHACLGNEYFLDHVHPSMAVHFLLAGELVDLLSDWDWIRVDPAWQPARAGEIFTEATAALDDDDYARRDLNLAKVLGWAGKYEEAAAAIARASGQLQGDPAYHYNAGILFEKQGRHAEALAEYEHAIAAQPDFFEAHFNRGKSLLALDRYEEAAAVFEHAATLKPGFAETHYNLAICYRELGRHQQALAETERASSWPAIESVRGSIYQRMGDWAAAVTAFETALTKKPEDAGAVYDLGFVYARMGDLDKAGGYFEKALSLQPDLHQAHRNLALIHRQQARPEQALLAYRAAANSSGDHLAAFDLAAYLHHLGRLEEAAAGYRRVLDLNPGFIKAYNNLGAAQAELGLFDKALGTLRQAVSLEPENPESHYNLAQFLMLKREFNEAAHHVDKAAALGMTIPDEVRQKIATGQAVVSGQPD